GSIKNFDLHMTNHGWSGMLEFDVFDNSKVGGNETDKLFDQFLKSPLIEVELAIQATISDTVVKPREPVTFKGIVTQRAVRELTVSNLLIAARVMVRRYRIEVANPAKVLWSQHYQVALYVNETMQKVITDQKSDLILFDAKWSWAGREPYKTPMVFLACDPS